ncbi:hypothetical protein A9Q84_11960 [Halobacteriovorax marinus]|uniref:Response regulatory domain-containing protein n=1 Tax=Halobacteriovorax marinus TaxID=97084 RepID=A0A1Y5FDT2_9BACT|nr:hypothetical protein A9Q84_11960 [Halobacteriovorax marinus]
MKSNIIQSILVVDDDPDFLVLFAKLISKIREVNVVVAKDGMEGILKSRNQKFEYIFTDYNMPKVNGDEFISTIRRSHYNQETPIIIVSSSTNLLEKTKQHFDHIYSLEKPVTVSSLRLALNKSPLVCLKTKKMIDTTFVNKVIMNFKDILQTIGNFKDIKKETTQKLNPEVHQEYDYYGCIIIHSELFNGIITVAFPSSTFEEYILENIDNTSIQSTDEIFETFIQTLVTKTKKMLNSSGDKVHEINSIFGVGHTELLSSRESILEFYTTFDSNKGKFFVQVSIWQ